jgi:hypothetical protein
MRKLKNQKRLSRSIEKIFISKKEERTPAEINGDPLLIKPKKDLECPIAETQVIDQQNPSNEPKATNSERANNFEDMKAKVVKTIQSENQANKEIQNSAQN